MQPTIFRNLEAFWAEWYEATQVMMPRSQDILEATVVHNRQGPALAQQHQVSEERIRQICVKAKRQLIQATGQNPDGELAHTSRVTNHWAERAGLYDAFQFRRVGYHVKTRLADQLIRLHALDPPQIDSLKAACAVAAIPDGRRSILTNMKNDIQKIMTRHPAGITPHQVRQELHSWHQKLDNWPRLEIGTFTTAWLNLAPSPQDGKIRNKRNQTTPSNNDWTLVQHHLAQALVDAGKCLCLHTIVANANRIARENGLQGNYQERTSQCVMIKKDQFRWVGQSTYGLTDWDVGHTDPSQKQGYRLQVSDEIIYLLRQAGKPLPIETVLTHINQRFTVGKQAIFVGVRKCPVLFIRRGKLHLMKSAHQLKTPRGEDDANRPTSLLQHRKKAS